MQAKHYLTLLGVFVLSVCLSTTLAHHTPATWPIVESDSVDRDNAWFEVLTDDGRRRISAAELGVNINTSAVTVVDDSTPSVLGATVCILANTSPKSISDFDDGTTGQLLVVVGDGFTTLSRTGLNLKGILNILLGTGDTVLLVFDGEEWRELTRTF